MSDELDNLEGFSQFLKPIEVSAPADAKNESGLTSAEADMFMSAMDALREAADMTGVGDELIGDIVDAFNGLSYDSKRKCLTNADAMAELADAAIQDGSAGKIRDDAFSNVPTPTQADMQDAFKRYNNAYDKSDYDEEDGDLESLIDDLKAMIGCIPAIENDIAKRSGKTSKPKTYADTHKRYTVSPSDSIEDQIMKSSMNMLYDEFKDIPEMTTASASYSKSDDDIGDEMDELGADESKDPLEDVRLPDITKRPGEKYKSVQGVPFTMREFAEYFNFDLDDLDNQNNSYDASKFAGFIPDGFDKFDRIAPVQCFYHAPDEDIMFVLMACHYSEGKCDWNGDVAFPAAYAIYRDGNGQYRTYVPKAYNLVDDSDHPITTDSIGLTNEALGIGEGKGGSDDESKPSKADAYIALLSGSGYDERKIVSELNDVIYRKAWSVTTLKDVGELTTSPICKQYDDGYVFVGTVDLNKSDETREFFSDMEMRIPSDRKIEFYLRMTREHLSANELRRAKDVIEKKMDIGPDSYIMTRDLKARGSILYIDCLFD